MTMELLARRPVPPRPVKGRRAAPDLWQSPAVKSREGGAVPEYERHWRDGDQDQDTIAELQGQVAGLEGELRTARAQAQRLMRMVRAQQETVKQAREAGRAEGYEQREAEERAQVPPPRGRRDPADRWLRAVPAVALAALLTCRGLFTAARHSKAAALAGHGMAAHKLLLAAAVPAAGLVIVAAPAMHVAPWIGGMPGGGSQPGPSAAVRAFVPGSSGGPSPASWATPDPSGSPPPAASGSSPVPPSPAAATPTASPTATPTATDSPPGTPSPSPDGTPTATDTPPPPDSPSPSDCTPAPSPAGM